jgi:hypothetical protein
MFAPSTGISKMKTTATVEQTKPIITAIYLLLETPDAVIALINTEDKYPKVDLYNSVTLHTNGAKIVFSNLPFERGNMIFMPDRHCLHVCIFSNQLEHALSFEGGGKCLFELP